MPRLLAAFVMLLVAVGSVRAEPPALVVRARPAGTLIGEGKAMAKLVGGEAGANDFDDWLDTTFGEDGLKGLDLGKPLVAYAHLKGKAADAKLFVAVPVSKEADFLDLLERIDREAVPLPDAKAVYRIGEDDDEEVLYFRFHDGHAHFVLHGEAKDLDPKTLLDPQDLLDADDASLLSATFRPGATDAAFLKSALEGLDKILQDTADFPLFSPDLSKRFSEWGKSLLPLVKTGFAEAESLTLRLDRAPGAKDVSVEAIVTPKKGTALAKGLATRKPALNRFAGLTEWPDAAAVLLLQQPGGNAEARAAFAKVIEAFGGDFSMWFDAPEAFDALFRGMAAPAKAGALELGIVLTAPDESGFGGAALALAHTEPARLLKALQDLARKPPESFGDQGEEFTKAVTLDAAKIGELSIHTIALEAFLPEKAKALFGEHARIALAFDKDAFYIAFGPNAVGILKRLPGVKPREASAVDLRVNARKLADWPKAGDDGTAELAARTLGKADKLAPVAQLSVGGTGELKLRAQLHLPAAGFVEGLAELLAGKLDLLPTR